MTSRQQNSAVKNTTADASIIVVPRAFTDIS